MILGFVLASAVTVGAAGTAPASPAGASAAEASSEWIWPVTGPLLRGFDPPDSPFGTGHRGIDVAAGVATPVLAPAAGTVTFAGPVGGRLFLTLDHGGGLESTYSWLETTGARRGDVVAQGQVVGTTGTGHTGSDVPHLHLGVRLDDVYVDPLAYLPAPDVSSYIRLAPLAA